MLSPTVQKPWPRISTTGPSASDDASAAPWSLLRTSMSVMPKCARISNTGAPVRRKLLMW